MKKKNLGSTVDGGLQDEGVFEDVSANAIARVLARQNVVAIPDFGDEAVRRRFGPSALTLFRRLMEVWQLSGEDARQLLALAPGTNLADLDTERLGEEQLLRISFVLGIYKSLHIVHGDELADRWVRLPNTNAMFGGQTPLACMTGGGIDTLRNVRRLLDGRAQGC